MGFPGALHSSTRVQGVRCRAIEVIHKAAQCPVLNGTAQTSHEPLISARRLWIGFEHTAEHLVAFVQIGAGGAGKILARCSRSQVGSQGAVVMPCALRGCRILSRPLSTKQISPRITGIGRVGQITQSNISTPTETRLNQVLRLADTHKVRGWSAGLCPGSTSTLIISSLGFKPH